MNQEFIKKVLEELYEEHQNTYDKDDFLIVESLTGKLERIDGEIRCGLKKDKFWNGTVDIHVDIDRFKNEKRAGFGELAVPARINNNGVGTMLMLCLIDIIKEMKEFYSIDEKVLVSGWLSMADQQNGNWQRSVPLYEKVGQLAKVDSYFDIGENSDKLTASEFLERANEDGYIRYLV